jgi:mannose/fructose/N-acetylgalactosamine-specific phosphotransferase system component IID
MKNTLMAPLGALGDSFFWGSLKPVLIIIAVVLLLAGAWWAPLLFFILYNCLHLLIRWRVMVWGYRSAGDLLSLMNRYHFTRMARVFKKMSLAVLGVMLALVPVWSPEFRLVFPGPGFVHSIAGLAIMLVLVAAQRKEGSPVKLMLGLAAVCLALAYAGVGE